MTPGIMIPVTKAAAYSSLIGNFHVPYKPRVNVSLFNMQNKSRAVLGLARSSEKENNWIPRKYSYYEFETEVKKWADRQCLPVGTVGNAAHPALESFVLGFVVKTIIDCLISIEASQIEEVLVAYTGEYRPILSSLLGSPLMCGRCYAVFKFSIVSIVYAMKRLRGKKIDTQTVLAAGFGAGVMVSLVSGMRGPCSIISIGVFNALTLGLPFKLFKEGRNVDLDEKLSQPQAEHERQEETKANNLFSIIFTFWFSKIYYLITSLARK